MDVFFPWINQKSYANIKQITIAAAAAAESNTHDFT